MSMGYKDDTIKTQTCRGFRAIWVFILRCLYNVYE